MASLRDSIGAAWGQLFGNPQSSAPPNPPTVNLPVAQRTAYPTNADAAQARAVGFGYGSGNETFLSGARSKDAGVPRGDYISTILKRLEAKTVKNTDPSKIGMMSDLMTKAAIAVKSSAITGLGFDPAISNIETSGQKTNLGGAYSPASDQIYANASDPSSIVHESTHRGLQQLRAAGVLVPEEKALIDTYEESVVRFIMQKYMGNPEAADEGKASKEQQDDAKWLFVYSVDGQKRQQILNGIEAKAAALVNKRHPMGPN